MPIDILEKICRELPRCSLKEIRLVNRHWATVGRSMIHNLMVDTKHYTHHSQLGAYLSRLAGGTYGNLKQLTLSSQFREGYENLQYLVSVTALDMDKCAADTNQLFGIAAMQKLTSLNLRRTQLKDQGSVLNALKHHLKFCRSCVSRRFERADISLFGLVEYNGKFALSIDEVT